MPFGTSFLFTEYYKTDYISVTKETVNCGKIFPKKAGRGTDAMEISVDKPTVNPVTYQALGGIFAVVCFYRSLHFLMKKDPA